MSEIKAIETEYNGILFRSRLEARWAVFFDAAGVKYEYEPYSFMLGGIGYVPDFYLPDYELYVEVKPFRKGAFTEIAKTFGLIGSEKIKSLLILSAFPEGTDIIALYNSVYLHPVVKAIVCERIAILKGKINKIALIPSGKFENVDNFCDDEAGFIVPYVSGHDGLYRDIDLHECFTKAKAYKFD